MVKAQARTSISKRLLTIANQQVSVHSLRSSSNEVMVSINFATLKIHITVNLIKNKKSRAVLAQNTYTYRV